MKQTALKKKPHLANDPKIIKNHKPNREQKSKAPAVLKETKNKQKQQMPRKAPVAKSDKDKVNKPNLNSSIQTEMDEFMNAVKKQYDIQEERIKQIITKFHYGGTAQRGERGDCEQKSVSDKGYECQKAVNDSSERELSELKEECMKLMEEKQKLNQEEELLLEKQLKDIVLSDIIESRLREQNAKSPKCLDTKKDGDDDDFHFPTVTRISFN